MGFILDFLVKVSRSWLAAACWLAAGLVELAATEQVGTDNLGHTRALPAEERRRT